MSRSNSEAAHSVGLLWTSDRPFVQTLPDNIQNSRQTSTPPVKFEHALPTSKRTQTSSLDRAATGVAIMLGLEPINFVDHVPLKNISVLQASRPYQAGICYYFNRSHPDVLLNYLKYIFQSNTTIYLQSCLQRQVSTSKSHHQAIHSTVSKIYQGTVHVWDPKKFTWKELAKLLQQCCPDVINVFLIDNNS